MKIVIDGYNLLMTCGFVSPERIGPGALRRARTQLIGILKSRLPFEQHAETAVVFDSSMSVDVDNTDFAETDIRVLFSNEFEDADSMIEELIRRHSAPKQLLVVSSDHRVQNAARRRKAVAVDSDDWFFEQLGVAKTEVETEAVSDDELLKLNEKLISESDSVSWTEIFGKEAKSTTAKNHEAEPDNENPAAKPESSEEIWNPFPDGYVDDLLEDE